MRLNEYLNAVAYFEAQHVMATSLKLAHMQSHAALNMGVGLTLDFEQLARALLLVLIKLLDRIVTRRYWRA
jgi:cytochrome c oxidase subunit IV